MPSRRPPPSAVLALLASIPNSILGVLLVFADTLARTLLAPRQLPVGALTAALGVPLFLILMSRSRSAAGTA